MMPRLFFVTTDVFFIASCPVLMPRNQKLFVIVKSLAGLASQPSCLHIFS